MNSSPDTREVLFCPTALLPIGLSLGALLIVLMHIAIFGSASGPDEDAAAHLWQILMAVQIPALTLFICRWLPKARRPTFRVLTLQGMVMALSVAAAAHARFYSLHL
jgi:hypothetical protein